MPKLAAWLGSLFNEDAKLLYRNWNHEIVFDDQETVDVLFINYKDFSKTIKSAVNDLILMGHLPENDTNL